MRDESKGLLLRLLEAPGPSGYEAAAARVWRDAASVWADVRADRLGNSFATVNAGGAPRVALLGHIDEIGLIVTHVDEETGVLWFGPIGSWDPLVIVGQRVLVLTAGGPLPGVVGRIPWHLQTADDLGKPIKLDTLWVDVGARDGADAASAVRVGDPIVLSGAPLELRHGLVASRALDNRVGALVALEAARRAAAAGDLAAEVVAVACVQEEISYAGAAGAAYGLDPDLAVVIDVTHATDYPDGDAGPRRERRPLGSGPAITRGATISGAVAERLLAVAAEAGLAHTVEAEGSHTLTDADEVVLARAGIPCGLVGVPLRYMHSPSETVDLADVDATAELIARFCRSLRPDQDWTR